MITNEKKKTDLTLHDFYYNLPPELIAQDMPERRDLARLLVAVRKTRSLTHRVFYDIIDYLEKDDVLVVNDSKVIPARIIGKKADTGISMEVVLLRQQKEDIWEALVRPGRRAKVGTTIIFANGMLSATVKDITEDGNRIFELKYDKSRWNIFSLLDSIGQMPLPPYITKPLDDNSKYQTVYANERGSAAAPTAGLHFTNELLDKISAKGVKIVHVMLHVGLGTFRPVKTEKIEEHNMHSEHFSLSNESADAINECRRRGKRVFAVGTTSCRVLESASDENGFVRPMCDDTSIFIYPGYKFKAVDALITNFHLPESTLLMLVSAFSSREFILGTYEEAIKERYRFFSFGVAMLIL